MVNNFIEIPKAVDPHLRRWMLLVDGENFTIRAQEIAKANGITLTEGPDYLRDVFIWFPGIRPTLALTNTAGAPVQVQKNAIRSYYYTSVVGDADRIGTVRQSLWDLGFQAEIFKKPKGQDKAKGVDIALSKDFLSHAFRDNYDVAVLVAGDGDYVPLIDEVKRLGKVVYVSFFRASGLNADLRLASDMFFEMDDFFVKRWSPTVTPKEIEKQ